MGVNNSFEKINYSLRPAKSIERKMILQFCMRLLPFTFVDRYHYIGFGSIYYSDFILFHKNLNITKMSSIEFERNESRAKFNLPYNCIELYAGNSNKILSSLVNKEEKSILWLDYDSPLSNSALDDIQTFSGQSSSGSMLLITVNANSDNNECIQDDSKKLFSYRLEQLITRVSKNKIPDISKSIDLNQKNLCNLYRKIITNEISETLTKRNKAITANEKIIYKQIMNYNYSDGAKMMTLGFIFFKNEDNQKFIDCKFDEVPTYSNSEEVYTINAPKLTTDEIRVLNKILPIKEGEEYNIPEINNVKFKKVAEEYSKVYQYFPQFLESLY
ncbi:MAG: hypothetical protein DRG78_00660 [Epsilonproteobacteria bacterium]|nr:MAG: hypothetical protein DRG78_00660 [Campylobacterota bacterium]